MHRKWLQWLAIATISAGGFFVVPPSLAHPPDDTKFAPIKGFGLRIKLEKVSTGLTAPLKGTVAPGHSDRLFVIDQDGLVWAVTLPTGAKRVFHDVSDRLVRLGVCGPDTFDERGLLGLAFHPDYLEKGLVYTYTSERNAGPPTFPSTLPAEARPDHQNVLAEWRVPNPADPKSVVDPNSRRELMRVDWPQFNHDGGDLAFGPDRMLYVSMGDGGGADDRDRQLFLTTRPPCGEAPIIGHGLDGNAQKLTNPLGKMLRIDVNGSNSRNGQYGIPRDNPFVGEGDDVIEEIWAFGFRNPFRFSFDKDRGWLYAADVGQNDLEEVDLVRKGANHGWPFKEGTMFFNHNGNDPGFASRRARRPIPPGLIDPIAQYDTHHEGHAIIGGFVYRGKKVPELRGRYVFGDYSIRFQFPGGPNNRGRLFHLQQRDPPEEGVMDVLEFRTGPEGLRLALLGFGQDAAGELYVLANKTGNPFGNEGLILRMVPGEH